MANPNLPEEILLEIFSRLPTKSVGKCRTLSKSWNTQLSASNFIKKHLFTRKLTIHQENLALALSQTHFIVTNEERINHSFITEKRLSFVGSCNGLILLAGFCGKYFLLLNPITRKQVTIQIPSQNLEIPYQNLENDDVYVYGFGYDCCNDDYKIVKICSSSLYGKELDAPLLYVYSLKNGVWEKVDYRRCGRPIPWLYVRESGAFVNGALHWFIRDDQEFQFITAFDLANEVFHDIPVPEGFRKQGNVIQGLSLGVSRWRATGLSVAGGCLVIVDNLGEGEANVWMLKEYGVAESWVRFCIDVGSQWQPVVEVMCFVKDGKLLCLTRSEFLFACDLESGTVEKVIVDEGDSRFTNGVAFVDSLVSP